MKKLVATSLLASTLLSSAAYAGDLNVKVYNPGDKGIFSVTSTILYGDKDAILVDAQFQKQHAEKLVSMIKETGKELKAIYISQSDPDFYFGLDTVKKAFPNAKVFSTAQTAYLISASKDDKLAVWKDKLKEDAPQELIVPEAIKGKLTLEGVDIDIKEDKKDPAHSYLWVAPLKTVLGGVSVSTGSHLWLADAQSETAIDNWISQIQSMKALNPSQVIPSHYKTADYSPEALTFVEGYLKNFKQAIQENKSSQDIISYMTEKYPDLPGKASLEMGAKVYRGEIPWDVKSPYPAIGNTVKVDFAGTKFDINFADNKTMSFIGTDGVFKGSADTVTYTPVEVAKNVFMVYWHEPKSGSNVTHVQDYNKGIVYTNIARKDGNFVNLKGTLRVSE
ncbi:MBL fold metallo-hydrolase [Microvirga sp. W0021]|uniref:MBL fold metallo-hydrolase n=1 Tax=Hohaiivirga grylli TaxID=3133970 RepID=A0ABV0BNJ2_9HYPH